MYEQVSILTNYEFIRTINIYNSRNSNFYCSFTEERWVVGGVPKSLVLGTVILDLIVLFLLGLRNIFLIFGNP